MNASALEKSWNVQVRSIELPARDQPGTSRRREAVSLSERSARRATGSGRTMAGKRLASPKSNLFKVNRDEPPRIAGMGYRTITIGVGAMIVDAQAMLSPPW